MKKIISALLCLSLFPLVSYNTNASDTNLVRIAESLTRGCYGVKVDNGVYLSWRLFGNEPISTTFDIYKNGTMIKSELDCLNYTDTDGTIKDIYAIVPHGDTVYDSDMFVPFETATFDIPVSKPESNSDEYSYEMHDASCADVDNDGEYEIIVKWEPSDYKDNSQSGFTDNVYLDCYETDGTKLWRIDLGINIRAGSHYTQYIAYDFDCDGYAELAVRTAPGSKDSTGAYVSRKGAAIDGEPLTWKNSYTNKTYTDESDLRDSSGDTIGKITKGPDWLTMFNGKTGEAIQTVNYFPQRGNVTSWGDDYANRSERFLAAAAYLDGRHPSLIMSRGYYERAAMAAYNWDGESFSLIWKRDDTYQPGTLYGNGNHQLSVCDADNDGKDEIVFGSTIVNDDGTILNSTKHGHGDALHVSDFNNDGKQEVFQVHEEYYAEYGGEYRDAATGTILANIGADSDVGRGLMANLDDDFEGSEFFTSANSNMYNGSAEIIGTTPTGVNPAFVIWWDGDLGREILWKKHIADYDINTSTKTILTEFTGCVHVGKDAPLISLDFFGDWREEAIYPTSDHTAMRLFMTTIPTEYKIPTLMHDTQYRCAVAWQNVGYNQPPHPKFFIGRDALDENEKYLAPATGYDKIETAGTDFSSVYTVRLNATGDLNRTINEYKMKYNSSLSYAYPKYIISNMIAYETAPRDLTISYGGEIEEITSDIQINAEYKQKYKNVVYFEDLDVDTEKTAGQFASNRLALNNSAYTSDYTLKPGKSYTIELHYYNAKRGSQIVIDEKTVCIPSDTSAAEAKRWGTLTLSNITVEQESAISTLPGSAGTYDPLDTILIVEEVSEYKITAGEAVFSENTVTLPVTADNFEVYANIYIAVHDSYGALKSISKQTELISGIKTISGTFTAGDGDTVSVYIWDDTHTPLCFKQTR